MDRLPLVEGTQSYGAKVQIQERVKMGTNTAIFCNTASDRLFENCKHVRKLTKISESTEKLMNEKEDELKQL